MKRKLITDGEINMKPIPMPGLQAALDNESYEWLAANSPIILEAVEREVANKRTPEQIRLFVLRHTSRIEIALRCEQVARHILASQR